MSENKRYSCEELLNKLLQYTPPKDRRVPTQNFTPASVLIFRCCRLSSLLCLYCGLWNLCFPSVCGPCRHALGLCLLCPVCVPCTGDFAIFGENPYMASVPVLYWRLWDFRKKSIYGFPLHWGLWFYNIKSLQEFPSVCELYAGRLIILQKFQYWHTHFFIL